ncbi:DUF4157 domain-containing protein [Mycolicibacterium sp. CBMA 361]|uniref:eCIS core domain-containing protein n=1 Tax=Mycolicibacterium sp. CBMA 361 TaxID=2606610 RepID=UPI0012DCE19E|nr:DUF4157 domain-containing protein [Mycolicibacterium sp. CBMA 361]
MYKSPPQPCRQRLNVLTAEQGVAPPVRPGLGNADPSRVRSLGRDGRTSAACINGGCILNSHSAMDKTGERPQSALKCIRTQPFPHGGLQTVATISSHLEPFTRVSRVNHVARGNASQLFPHTGGEESVRHGPALTGTVHSNFNFGRIPIFPAQPSVGGRPAKAGHSCSDGETKKVQTLHRPSAVPPQPGLGAGRGVRDAITSTGRPLDDQTVADMEQRLGDDFSAVRIHTGSTAAASAAAVNAAAYTVGNDIVFGSGLPSPQTTAGRRALAHELVHVTQQRRGPVSGSDWGEGISVSHPGDRFEKEATEVAERAVNGASAPPRAAPAPAAVAQRPVTVQRDILTTWSGGLPPPDMINTSGNVNPEVKGNVEAAPMTGQPDLVKITSPDIMMPPMPVALDTSKYEISAGKSVHVGFVQTVSSSQHVAKYQAPADKPGDPPVEFEQDSSLPGAARDVTLGRYETTGRPTHPQAEAPWFLAPVTISSVHKVDNLKAAVDGVANLFDRPGFAVPKTYGKGNLVGFRGATTFLTSVVAKDADGPASDLTHLAKSTWTVPWDATLDASMVGHGNPVTARVSKQAPSAVTGPTARESEVGYLALDKAAAMVVDPENLFPNLTNTKKADAAGVGPKPAAPSLAQPSTGPTPNQSYGYTVAALKAKNPTFEVEVTCRATDATVGRDTVRFNIAKTNAHITKKLNKDDSATLTFHLNDVFDPSEEMEYTEAHIWVTCVGGISPIAAMVPMSLSTGPGARLADESQDWTWRVATMELSATTKDVGTGKYSVKGRMLPTTAAKP